MTANWLLMIVWMLVASISIVEMWVAYSTEGISSVKTWFLAILAMVAFYFVFRHRNRRNTEKKEQYGEKTPKKRVK
jgi:membrane protein implicated in regulation of membrane protease activity